LDTANHDLSAEKLEAFLETRVIGFRMSFALLQVEHLALDFRMPHLQKAVESLRASLAEMKGVVSIRTNPGTFEALVGLSVDRHWSSYEILFPSLMKVYINHRMVHSLSTWSCLCLYMVWRAMNNLSTISSVFIEDVSDTDDEGLADVCASIKAKLPRFFPLQIHLTRNQLIYASYYL
jgi:hypothetical protein